MKIALLQNQIIWEDKNRNIARIEKIISNNPDMDLYLLPEMSFTGFSMNISKTAETGQETVDQIRKIAVDKNVSIGFGWVRQKGTKCENVYSIIDNKGILISEYTKIHPFSYSGEDKFFSGGNRITTFTIGGIPFSAFICYDLRFPELFRIICRDVHAVIIPANWPAKRSEHWKILLRARAIENQMYIFAVNCVGDMNGSYYSGDSCIINPNGDVIMSMSDQEGVLKYEFIDDVDQYRKAFPVLDDIKTSSVSRYSFSSTGSGQIHD